MDNQIQSYVMRDFASSPAGRVLRIGTRLSLKTLFLGAVLFLAIPSSGPDIPVRSLPDYARARSLATLVSAPEAPIEFTQYVSWVAPPRFDWNYFADVDDFAVFDLSSSESEQQVVATLSDISTLTADSPAAPFFVPDSFGLAPWDFTVPDGGFVVAASPKPRPTPEPRSSILIGMGVAGLTLIELFRRKRQSFARQRV